MSEAAPLLVLRGWSLDRETSDGCQPVLQDLDLEIVGGRWLAVLGANGAGKSSLLKYLAGEQSPLADQVAIMCQDPDEQIFANVVAREITMGRPDLDVVAICREFGLEGLEQMDPRLLSAGQKQRLVLAVALDGAPNVLLCDEPTSLQDPAQASWMLARLDQWRQETGGALVTATCDRAEAARADELLVLADGRVLLRGTPQDLLEVPEVVALLGPKVAAVPPKCGTTGAVGAPPALTLVGVGCDFAPAGGFDGLDWVVAPGERWGLVGPNGCGKSTLLAVCAGARRPQRGTVTLGAYAMYEQGALDLDHGRALLAPQFPEYLFTRATVAAELALDPALAEVPMDEFLAQLALPPDLAGRNPYDLSSGQRRRLALGLVLRSGRPLVLLDEPTAALDAAGRACLLAMLKSLPPTTALVIASHDRRFLAQAGCRICEVTTSGLVSESAENQLAEPAAGD